jgi:hypothetical protein
MMTQTTQTTQTFAKGQQVTFLGDWDQKGTVVVRDMVVHSCGRKQMTLHYADGTFAGRNYLPTVRQDYGGANVCAQVHPRMTEAEAEARGLEMAAEILAYERARYERIMAIPGNTPGYLAAMRRGLGELHEPRVVRRDR